MSAGCRSWNATLSKLPDSCVNQHGREDGWIGIRNRASMSSSSAEARLASRLPVRAAECGVRVGLVDDNPSFGGQIWRGEFESGHDKNAVRWSHLLRGPRGHEVVRDKKCFHQPEAGVLLAEGSDSVRELRYQNLVLATGARERFLPFPGWTLPNVMGAGGLQAVVKSGLTDSRANA